MTTTAPPVTIAPASRAPSIVVAAGWVAAIVLTLAILLMTHDPQTVGVLSVFLMLVMMFIKVPVYVALSVPGLLGLYSVTGSRAMFGAMSGEPFESVANWELSVLPMFIMMGMLLWQSGITASMFNAAQIWLRWLPGGLGVGTAVAGAGMASVSGSSMGTVHALARIAVPEMIKNGYDRRLAVGAVLMASLPGSLIPPSIMLVIYAGIANVPVGPQLMAGLVPGIVVTLMCCAMIVAMCVAFPRLAPRTAQGDGSEPTDPREKWRVLFGAWPLPVLMLIVLGGMFSGVLTATEAGAAGAAGSLLLALWVQRGHNAGAKITTALQTAVASSGSIFLLILGAYLFARMLSVTRLGPTFTDWVIGMEFSKIEFLLIMLVAYFVMGMFMDPLSIMLLTVPLLVPVLVQLDISLYWYGVFAVFMGEIAIITPPVGILSFIVYSIVRHREVNLGTDISLKDVFVSVLWFLPLVFAFVLLMIFVPELVTYLPDKSALG